MNNKHLPNLTPIRFLLALLVMLFHIPQFSINRGLASFDDWSIFHKGTEAVYMFFTLSGFLIIRQLYEEKTKTGLINLRKFFLKRILRIFPLYYLVLSFGFIYYQLILPYFGFSFDSNYDLLTGILLSVTLFPNIFATYSPGGILEILWSIGIEEQFYLFIAPLFFFLPAKKTVLFLILFTAIYFSLYFSDLLPFLGKYSMLFFYFSFSGLCSVLMTKKRFNTIIQKLRIPLLIMLVIYFTTSIFSGALSPIYYNLFSFILFGLSISTLSQRSIKVLDNKLMNHLGKISYGIYMYHAIAMQFVGLIFLKGIAKIQLADTLSIILFNLLVIGITIVLAHFSYKYFESYFLSLKGKMKLYQ